MIYDLTFTKKDLNGVDTPHNDALVLMINICYFDMKRVLIDHGSSFKVMNINLYNKLQPYIPRKVARSVDMPIYTFNE